MSGQSIIAIVGGIGGLIGAVGLIWYPIRRRRSALRARFSGREELIFSEWYLAFFGQAGIEQWVAQDIIEVIGNELGVAPTKLRPSDRLDVELQDESSRWIDGGYKVTNMTHDVGRVLYKRLPVEVYDPKQTPATLGELIQDADLFIKACRSIQAGQEPQGAS